MKRGILSYWWGIVRFALLGRTPSRPEDIPLWALSIPYRLWLEPCRPDGRSFEALYFGRIDPQLRARLPLRRFFLLFLLLWPFMAGWRALKRGWGAWRYFRGALALPELAIFHPAATYTDREWAWSRPDTALCMLYAWQFHHTKDAFLELDDKRRFLEAARRAGFPVPPTFTRQEAMARGGEYIVKDPLVDLGAGVELMPARELCILEDDEDPIIQPRLYNHPKLLEVLPAKAPLSTFRVTTMLDPDTGEPAVSRCAIRIGRAGSISDNTAQGGIWARIDLETGAIQAGVTKKTFGLWRDGAPVREGSHPDTGRSFVGMQVPYWEEGRRLALEAHKKLAPEAVTLGWDVALTDGGPMLLEVNVWTVCYDYDPQTDALTPACRLILERLTSSSRV